jgi:hypothetical protein
MESKYLEKMFPTGCKIAKKQLQRILDENPELKVHFSGQEFEFKAVTDVNSRLIGPNGTMRGAYYTSGAYCIIKSPSKEVLVDDLQKNEGWIDSRGEGYYACLVETKDHKRDPEIMKLAPKGIEISLKVHRDSGVWFYRTRAKHYPAPKHLEYIKKIEEISGKISALK